MGVEVTADKICRRQTERSEAQSAPPTNGWFLNCYAAVYWLIFQLAYSGQKGEER